MGPNVEYEKYLAREKPDRQQGGRRHGRKDPWLQTAVWTGGGRGWGQGDRLRVVPSGPDGGGASQGHGNRNGQKGVTWGHRRQGLVVLVRDEMKGQVILFTF